jgi:rare lipoprotein A
MSAQSKKLLQRDILPFVAFGLLFSMSAVGAERSEQPASKAAPAASVSPFKATGDNAKPVTKPVPKQITRSAPGPITHTKVTPRPVQPQGSAGHAMAYDSQGRVIRRVAISGKDGAAAGFDHTLLDDGTFWREDGSRTTWQQTGMASWYGGARWQGKRTSSGERFDQNQLTAAHATLPIGTKVRVARTDGSGSVVVTINDRPGTRTRIIDLSRAAAKELGILTAGVTMVTLRPL